MLKIIEVEKNSQSYKKGIRENDIIEKINGYEAVDQLDILYYSNFENIEIEIKNKGKFFLNTENLGLTVENFKIRRCNNNCIFCFVSQMPDGCRKSLYIKDDDYRLSFLYGAYITLNNMTEKDYKRIDRLNLSPLYVSVHTVDKRLRADILKSKKIINIKKKLKKLKDMNILLHTQVVLMPGINDGENLIETLDFLTGLYPAVQTVSLVPVGLTCFRDNMYSLNDYNKKEAKEVIEIAEKYQNKFLDEYKEPLVYITDEFYIKADKEFPEYKKYEIYEDGVGMYQVFKEEFDRNLNILKNKNFDKSKKIGIITSVDGKKVLERFIKKIKNYGITIELLPVVNDFFGENITVTGLLTGIDIKRKIQNIKDDYDKILIPDIVLNEENLLLDDYHKNDLIKIGKGKIEFVNSDAKSLIKKVAE
ncbi:MAG: DUF512 domain-containing protein [Candidatus Mcinerneyibacterium aminivorans]|uniref:DUF512 domain-containing protein n=1 Tax=Candidatus Mcinerneyibacterium aminivorans TaxID=2703815 RepID=A0A5D0MHD3_9BACT|nr:MAG: DUF512 domain-containing protein [Candidatus Mcinerneyibacterium aminivorans]